MPYRYASFEEWYDTQTGLSAPEAELELSFNASREMQGSGPETVTLLGLQAKISTAEHSEIVIPPGIHEMVPRSNGDANLYIGSKNRLQIRGPGVLKFPTGKGGIIFSGPEGPTPGVSVPSQDCLVSGIGIMGGKDAITIRSSNRITIRDCVIYGEGTGRGIVIEHRSHDVHLYSVAIESRDKGIELTTPDSIVRDLVIRRCRVGIFWNGPGTIISGTHVFPEVDGETEYGMICGPWASHLALAEQCYFDNCQYAFITDTGEAWIDGTGPVFRNTLMNNQRHKDAEFVVGDLTQLNDTMAKKKDFPAT
jgi:hypothetical protein